VIFHLLFLFLSPILFLYPISWERTLSSFCFLFKLLWQLLRVPHEATLAFCSEKKLGIFFCFDLDVSNCYCYCYSLILLDIACLETAISWIQFYYCHSSGYSSTILLDVVLLFSFNYYFCSPIISVLVLFWFCYSFGSIAISILLLF
jgi:hypothetical protein